MRASTNARRAIRQVIAVLVAAFVMTAAARTGRAARIARDVWTSSISRTGVSLSSSYEYQFITAEKAAGVDPYMYLLDVYDRQVAKDDDAGGDWNSLITYRPPSSGTYYVVVRGFSTASSGTGKVLRRARDTCPTCTWGPWVDITGATHFGGSFGAIETDQSEYWTVNVQSALNGTNDTVLYPMSALANIQGYNDDSGVGRMSFWARPSDRDVQYFLVGTYATGTWGYTDVLANDRGGDTDGDTVGPGLEAELGTCDSSTTSAGCANVIDKKDSDHDGITDFHETFGKDVDKSEWQNALHLPAWGADPRKKDVFIEQDWMDSTVYPWHSTITSNPFNEARADQTQGKYSVATQTDVRNLAGGGIWLHYDMGTTGNPCPNKPKLCGAWGQGGTKIVSSDHKATQATDHTMHSARSGIFRHMLVFSAGGTAHGYPASTFDAGLADVVRADPVNFHPKNLIHELGHSLGLAHDGWSARTDGGLRDEMNCKPHYNSLMNYAYDLNWATDSDKYNFSTRSNTNVIDPARVSETANLIGPYDAGRLQYLGVTPYTSHWFPKASQTGGNVDWNRSNTFPDSPASGAVRSSVIAGPQCAWHSLVTDSVGPMTDVSSQVGPDVGAFRSPSCSPACPRLYVANANLAQTGIGYRWTAHTGNTDRAGCSKAGSTGAVYTSCHEFQPAPESAAFTVPYVTGTVTSVAVLPWNGKFVVAYRTSDRKVWVNVATGTSEPSGELTGWSSTPREVTTTDTSTLADSIDIELSPMYVSTSQGYPATELLAIFYANGTGSAAVHRMRYTNTSDADPVGAWAGRDVIISGASAPYVGDNAPGVTVWPARSLSGGASYSSVGYACGASPGTFVPADTDGDPPAQQPMKFLCYDKTSDRWTDLTSTAMPNVHAFQRRPGIAFHTLRAATPTGAAPDDPVAFLDPADPTKGQFWVSPQDFGFGASVFVGTIVSQSAPPSSSMRIYWLHPSHVYPNNALALYADRDVSAIKAVGIYGNPLTYTLFGIFDGAFHATLRDENDFKVMEHGICVGLIGNTGCGTTSCFNYCWGPWPCPTKPTVCP